MRDFQLRTELAERGVFFPTTAILAHDGTPEQMARHQRWCGNWALAAQDNPHLVTADLRTLMDGFAGDAQPAMVTTPNAGIPLLFASIVDPEVIRIVFQPLNAVEILGGEAQRGTWVDQVAYFPTAEFTGSVATYGDYSNNGAVDVNANWTPRQPYHWQAFKRYGEQQLARYGAAGLNYEGELSNSLAYKFQQVGNEIYFNGVSGLTNYGLLNDPSLPAAISPLVKAITTAGVTWTYASVIEKFNDIKKLFGQLVIQMGGNVTMDAKMTLAISNTRQIDMVSTNDFGITLRAILKEAFPNMRIVTAPQYTASGGELMQLILDAYQGQRTALPAYTEKMRAHAMVTEPSAWAQKTSAGSWGTIIRRPIAIAQMLGI
ncbi:hypothetical protein [Sphingobium sp. WCS2017Hpa-17]|uniref:hypothetical protein n=1 Tax=Sphingobium sp. WCS2017Hpa-17 TaxID=3073638 RepID=UPI0028896782|nr:hypothetical protein [Sphingobium sp. WCS2017Hpa-17]